VITLIPLAAFELVVGLPVATQALQRVRQAAARLFEVTDVAAPVVDPEVALPLPDGPYDLEARSLWAGYPNAGSPVLRGLDLTLTSGRRVAVVGPSGAGKSTLAAVLLRFLPLAAGSVLLNGVPLDRLSGDDVRTGGGPGGPGRLPLRCHHRREPAHRAPPGHRRRVAQAVLDRVGLAGWLEDLPKGLGTEVGRHGSRLSGGQRQRVAVARALLADFPVLVLDEPAEHLDPLAADALTSDILSVTDDRSLVLITHRLAGLESVDEILVMEEGRVVERGTHDELIDQDGRYSRLWWEEMRTERHATVETPATPALHHHPKLLTRPAQTTYPAQTTATAPPGGPSDRRDA
jgi:ABC-type multidrug transport system fused ATPase/permease subunit